jgi:hypothetical protein
MEEGDLGRMLALATLAKNLSTAGPGAKDLGLDRVVLLISTATFFVCNEIGQLRQKLNDVRKAVLGAMKEVQANIDAHVN